MAEAVLLLYVPVVVVIFATVSVRRALLAVVLLGYLFLPVAGIELPGLPDFDKTSAISIGAALGMAVFAPERLSRFRPHWIDLPAAVLVVVPGLTSLVNGLGAYDAGSAMIEGLVFWGLPWCLGRVGLASLASLDDFLRAVVFFGLPYAVLAVWEVRMSPQLHNHLYGFHPHQFIQQMRGDGFRPTVFLDHGITVATWFAYAALAASSLALASPRRRALGVVPYAAPAAAFVAVVFLCKTFTAYGLLALGLAALAAAWFRASLARWAVLGLVSLPMLVVVPSLVGPSPLALAERAIAAVNPARASSLGFRLDNEAMLVDKALRKPVLGWGRWGRSRVYDETGRDISVTDGLWVITLGESGLLGLAGLMLMFTLPVWVLGWRARGLAREPRLLLAGGCVIVSLNLFNTIPNAPVLPPVNLLAGGLGTMAVAAARGARPASRRGRGGRGPDAEAEAPPWPRSIPMQTRSLP